VTRKYMKNITVNLLYHLLVYIFNNKCGTTTNIVWKNKTWVRLRWKVLSAGWRKFFETP